MNANWTEQAYFAALDWAQDHHDVVVVDRTGQIVAELRFAHSATGWAEFSEKMKPFGSCPIALETCSGPAVDQLLQRGFRIYPVSPKASQRYRDRKLPSGTKTDRHDAWSLADALRTDGRAWRVLHPQDEATAMLRALCRDEITLIEQRTALISHLRRMLIDQRGERKAMLKMGEQKSIQTDRVVLVRGPEEEIKIVRWIFQAFIGEGKSESEIAAILNAQGIVTDFGRAWNRVTVHQILTNEKYIGNNVYHRTSCKLKKKHVVNPPDKWIRANGVFEGVVEPELFWRAREIILARSQKLTDEEMLEKLRTLLKQHGRISGILIDEAEGLPSSTAFRHRFGTLVSAYRLIGYPCIQLLATGV